MQSWKLLVVLFLCSIFSVPSAGQFFEVGVRADEIYVFKLLEKEIIDSEDAVIFGVDLNLPVEVGQNFTMEVINPRPTFNGHIELQFSAGNLTTRYYNDVFVIGQYVVDTDWQGWVDLIEGAGGGGGNTTVQYSQNATHFEYLLSLYWSSPGVRVVNQVWYDKRTGVATYNYLEVQYDDGEYRHIVFKLIGRYIAPPPVYIVDSEAYSVNDSNPIEYEILRIDGFEGLDFLRSGSDQFVLRDNDRFTVQPLGDPINNTIQVLLKSQEQEFIHTVELNIFGSFIIFTDWSTWNLILNDISRVAIDTPGLTGDKFYDETTLAYALLIENNTHFIEIVSHYEIATGILTYSLLEIWTFYGTQILEYKRVVDSPISQRYLPTDKLNSLIAYDYIITGSNPNALNLEKYLGIQPSGTTGRLFYSIKEYNVGSKKTEFLYYEGYLQMSEEFDPSNRFDQPIKNIGSLIIHSDWTTWTQELYQLNLQSRTGTVYNIFTTKDAIVFTILEVTLSSTLKISAAYDSDNGILLELSVEYIPLERSTSEITAIVVQNIAFGSESEVFDIIVSLDMPVTNRGATTNSDSGGFQLAGLIVSFSCMIFATIIRKRKRLRKQTIL